MTLRAFLLSLRLLRIGALLAGVLLLSGCRFRKEPLRAGWLISGVFEEPPRPRCRPPRRPGRPYRELNRWRLPSWQGNARVVVRVPWLAGTFAVDQRAPGTRAGRTWVSPRASRPMRIVEDRGVMQQLPGFVAGIDLQPYRRIAFIVDTSGYMCRYPGCPDGQSGTNIPAVQLKVAGDQIDAAVAGLRPDQSFAVYIGSTLREMRFEPKNPAGRALAGAFVRGQVCSLMRGIRDQVRRAVADGADVIVLMSDGHQQRRENNYYRSVADACQAAPSILYCYVDQNTEVVDLGRLGEGKRLPPFVTVSIERRNATWMRNLAEATGGAYVELAP
ncbi:MAG: hypothetical protein AAF928_17030 [Myxococcota bacterium]